MSFDVESELKSSSAQQLRQEKHGICSQLLHVQQQISDLAYGNYRTYADAGSTTEHCRKRFTEANGLVDSIDTEISGLRENLGEFRERSGKIAQELACLKSAESKESPLWDILSLPTRMDVCIRAGYYEDAYLLTNYGMQLQQHGLTKNPLIKVVSDKLVDARHHLLNELFNRFAGPIDLASSIQVVNNIRKIPCLSPTQLRVSILHYRDLYLEKQLMNIKSQPDFILRMVEVYRDCMYDTMVMHLAVFPESESVKRDPNIDPRWDVWQAAGPSAVLSEWALHNLETMFDYIRNCEDSSLDVGALSAKLMSFAASFGRMGIDFRPLVANAIHHFVVKRFSNSVLAAASKFTECESIVIDGDVPGEVAIPYTAANVQPAPPAALTLWDDLCIYGNAIIGAFNQLRNGLSSMQIHAVLKAFTKSLKIVFRWLDRFADRSDQQEQFVKAVKLIAYHFVPYFNRCLLVLFPYEKCCRPFYNTAISLEQYERSCGIALKELYADCNRASVFEELIGQIPNSEETANLELSQDVPTPENELIIEKFAGEDFQRNQIADFPNVMDSFKSEESKLTDSDVASTTEDDQLVFTARKRSDAEKETFSEISLA